MADECSNERHVLYAPKSHGRTEWLRQLEHAGAAGNSTSAVASWIRFSVRAVDWFNIWETNYVKLRRLLSNPMSLHTQCPKRIASTSAHRTVWRRWAVRCYATSTADDPEWFTQVRNSLLSRKPSFYKEYLDPLHNGQLRKALQGFQPKPSLKGAGPTTVLLPELLTRFNARMPSATLLPDGTDPLHSPGGPWVRRMWAGGAVRLNSSLQLAPGLPLDPQKMVACLERITDVRLQGTGTAAKIFVTVQRSVAQNEKALGVGKHLSKPELIADTPQQVDRSKDWRAVLLKEERNLVFMKSKTEAEHTTAPSGESFVPRYLKCTDALPIPLRRLTGFSTHRSGLLPRTDADTFSPIPILCAHVQRSSSTPGPHVRPQRRRPSQSPCTWTAHAHTHASSVEQAPEQETRQ